MVTGRCVYISSSLLITTEDLGIKYPLFPENTSYDLFWEVKV